MNLAEIIQYTDNLDKQAKALIKNTLRQAWHMRGSLNLDEAYMLDAEQSEAIDEIIKENFEFTKETRIPFI
jgi:hypothetical protein